MFDKSVLPNGLRVVSSSLPHTRSVSINIFLGAGSRYESDDIAGVSHFLEHMLFKGTRRRPTAREISEEIEGIGGVMNAGTDKELTVYWAKVGDHRFAATLDILADSLLNSLLDPTELEKEREVILEELAMTEDSPADMVNILIVERVSEYLGGWQSRPFGTWYPAQIPDDTPRLRLRSKKTEQAHFCLATPGLSAAHPDRYVLDVLNAVLGEGMSSRLFLEIREKRSLCYDVHSYVNHYLDTGSTVVSAGVDPRKLDEALRATMDELLRMAEPVPERELAKAKEFIKGRLQLRMEDTRAVASWLGGQELLRREILTVDEVLDIVDAVTAESLERVARELWRTEAFRLALVGPFRSESRFQKLLAA